MTPGARLQAAIELLGEIRNGSAPADRAAAHYFRNRRFIGGQDRRDVIERVYAILRARARLEWWIARKLPVGVTLGDGERTLVLAGLALIDRWAADRVAGSFDGGQYRPATLKREERALAQALEGESLDHEDQPAWVRLEFPKWLERDLRSALGDGFEAEMRALMKAAATDLRANRLKADRDQALAALKEAGIEAVPSALSPWGLRVAGRPPLASLKLFQDGLVEVQDEGSQLVALLTDAAPGMRVVDFCAGAGGKTLALAAQMKNKGQIVACDTLTGRVERAATRLRRAGAHNVERRGLSSERDPWVKRHAGAYDRVLVDAPCSGSGTWRRNPDQKWRLDPKDIVELAALQARILDSAQRLVKKGGRLVYATCSLLPAENQRQVEQFLARHPDFRALDMREIWQSAVGGAYPEAAAAANSSLSLSPARHGTDGFFVAAMERIAAPAKAAAETEAATEAATEAGAEAAPEIAAVAETTP